MHAQLESVPTKRTLSTAELRSLVSSWTLTLKAGGVPPEKALVTVKTLVREAIAPHVVAYDGTELADDRSRLTADASRWCIDAYFSESHGQPGLS